MNVLVISGIKAKNNNVSQTVFMRFVSIGSIFNFDIKYIVSHAFKIPNKVCDQIIKIF